jgi:hypothetical protein
MTAFNTVRFRVKPGRDQDFLDAHKKVERNWEGLQHINIIKTGDRTYCIIAEWTDMDALAAARPSMIATLDTFRDTLEDLGSGLGLTDPISGPVVLALKWADCEVVPGRAARAKLLRDRLNDNQGNERTPRRNCARYLFENLQCAVGAEVCLKTFRVASDA